MKSSFTDRGNSIHVEEEGIYLIISDPDMPPPVDGNWMRTSRVNFKAFIEGIKAGEFDHLAEEPR